MMILRARVKAAQELTRIACCQRMLDTLLSFKTEICVSAGAKLKGTTCQFCRKPFMGMRVHGLRGWRIDPKYWDIEEAIQ